MKLRNDLYTILEKQETDNKVSYILQLNADHLIYAAHFPGQPITPGVCVVHIAVELLTDYLQHPLEIRKVKNVKFLSVLSPVEHPTVTYELSKIAEMPDGQLKAQVFVMVQEKEIAKLSLIVDNKE